MLSSTLKLSYLPFSLPFFFSFIYFFTACKSLLNKKSDSAKVRLSRHLSALFCSVTSCPVSSVSLTPFLYLLFFFCASLCFFSARSPSFPCIIYVKRCLFSPTVMTFVCFLTVWFCRSFFYFFNLRVSGPSVACFSDPTFPVVPSTS